MENNKYSTNTHAHHKSIVKLLLLHTDLCSERVKKNRENEYKYYNRI